MISRSKEEFYEMKKVSFNLPAKTVECFFHAAFTVLRDNFSADRTIFVTDRNVFTLHRQKFEGYRTIVIEAGESFKKQSTIDDILKQLVEWEVNKLDTLIGVGGGVITDLAGFAASIYKRGISLVLVPTTLLAMIDAALGGKNGIDIGPYKNMAGTIYQPQSIWYDFSFLDSLPAEEWRNGMAEMIKHACIADEGMFQFLEALDLHKIMTDPALISDLVERNVGIKMDIVIKDEFDRADRQLLNFGHTIGHAIEKLMDIPHGHAVSIGMVSACALSEKAAGLQFDAAARVVRILALYGLPVDVETDVANVFEVLKKDKKRTGGNINFVFMDRIGNAFAREVPVDFIHENLIDIL